MMGKKIITIILLLGIILNSRVLFAYAENENTAESTESESMLEETEDLELKNQGAASKKAAVTVTSEAAV